MKDITIAVPFVKQTLAGAERAGYDVKRLLKSNGISPSLLERPRARVSLDSFVGLLQQLMRLMDDESLGLLDRPQRLGSFGLVARSTLHEANLIDAMHCYVRSMNLFNAGLIHYVSEVDSRVIYGLRVSESLQLTSTYILESAIMTAHRFFCWLCRSRIPVERVDLSYAPPAWVDEYRYLFFGAPVRFDQPEVRIWLHGADMSKRVKQDARSLDAYLQRAPRDMFTPVRNPQVSHAAREHLIASIRAGTGVPRIEETASRLGYSTQTFWRRLRDEGTDYTGVRTQARRDSAIVLLGDSSNSVERIAETLGFSESSSFIRAFRQWTGMTPMAYRKA